MVQVEILDKDLTRVAIIKVLYPINNKGMVLRYSKELSDYGECLFRVSTKDPFFDVVGDVLQPHSYNVRVTEDGGTVWAGVIVDNSSRNKNFVEVKAVEYEFYLDKILIRRDSASSTDPNAQHYRTFTSGTMASAVQTLFNNAQTDFGANHPLAAATIGTIDNPDYPPGFADANGAPLTGAWNFSDFITLQFDYHTVYYVLKAFGLYTNCDFEIDEDLVFNFKEFIGNKNSNIVFAYGAQGNIVDYDVPRLGRRMINDLTGIAATEEGTILHASQRNESSIQSAGLLQGSAAYTDAKDLNFLKTRLAEELQFLDTVDSAPMNVLLDERVDRSGTYGIGDIVTIKVQDNIIDFQQPRRIVGITTTYHNTGKRLITVQTNAPRERDMGGP